MKLLTVENAKTIKGEELGYRTGILYLAPSFESGVIDTCPKATAGCKAGCLFRAGRASFTPMIITARIRKTRELANDRAAFIDQLRKDIRQLLKQCARLKMLPAVRINGTSDLPQVAMQLAREFPDIQFYDYTKIPAPWKRSTGNYHLTFSLSESNLQDSLDALRHGVNVAAVFNVKRGHELPATWNGFDVIDGDAHDLRFLNTVGISPTNVGRGLVIGLRAKGPAKKDTSGFVQIADLSVGTLPAACGHVAV